MDQARETASQLERYIEDKRADLGSNLQELERKVRSVANWKRQFEKQPLTILGVAFGGGIFLATLLGKRSNGYVYPRVTSGGQNAGSTAKDKALETMDNIKEAAVGAAAVYFKQLAEEVIPGFSAQYDKVAATTHPA